MKRRLLKFTGYFFLVILILTGLIYLALQTSTVQNYISDKILENLSEKYNAEWSIDDIDIDFMDEVNLNVVLFKDQQGDTLLYAEKVKVDIGLVNLFGKEIRLDEIIITAPKSHIYTEDDKINFDFLIPKEEKAKTQTDTTKSSWAISIGDVLLTNPDIEVDLEGQAIDLKMNSLRANFSQTDFANKQLSLSLINLSNVNLDFSQFDSSKEVQEFEFPDLGWNISAQQLSIENSKVNYKVDDETIKISDLELHVEDVQIDTNNISAKVEQIGLLFNDEIKLDQFESDILFSGDKITLSELSASINDDLLKIESIQYNINDQNVDGKGLNLDIEYSTLKQLEKYLPQKLNLAPNVSVNASTSSFSFINNRIVASNLNAQYGNIITAKGDFQIIPSKGKSLYIDSDIKNVKINIPSVSKLWDGFTMPDSLKRFKNLTVSGDIEGNLENFNINEFNLSLDDALNLQAAGNVKNITDVDSMELDVDIKQLTADASALPIPNNEKIVLDSLGLLDYSGSIKGSLDDLLIKGKLNSELGSLNTDVSLDLTGEIENITYKGNLQLNKFDVGTLLKNDQLGKVSIQLNLDGQGLDLDNLNSRLDGVISGFTYNGYEYSDINIDASIADREIKGKINIDDENAKFNYNGTLKLDSTTTILDFTALIDTLNLKSLGFVNQSLSMSGEIDSEIRLPLRSGEKGKIDILNLILSNENELFKEDSIAIRARKTADSTYVTMDADFVNIDIEGEFGIRDIPASMGGLLDYYINLDTTFVHFDNRGKSLKIAGQIKTLAPVNIFLTETLLQAGLIKINSNFDFVNKEVKGEITIDSFFYSTFFSEELKFKVDSESKDIFANLSGENNSISGIEIPIIDIKNNFSRQNISTTFLASDSDKLPRLKFSLNTDFKDEFTEITLKDSLILNRKDWTASNDNNIKIYNDKVVVNNLALTDNNEYLTINSTDAEGSGLNIDFNNFNIGQFSTLLTSKPSKLNGNINGTVELMDMNTDIYYLVNLKVEDIVYDSTTVGVLEVKATDDQATEVLTTELSLTGPEYDVRGGGTYHTKTTAMDFDVDINSFQLMLVDPFLSEIMRNSEGGVTGQVSVDGNAEFPEINGELTLQDVVTTIVVNNTRYGLDKQTISFDNNSIDIGIIDFFDDQNNYATLTGKIYHSYLQDIELDLNLDTDKFTFLNTTESDNPVFYGKMVLGADIDLTGPIDLIDVQATARTLDSTQVTISPFSIERFLLDEGFVTYGKPSDFEDLSSEYLLKLARQFPFKVNIILDATQEAKMNFVVDPVTGDKIEGSGSGNLRIKLNPDGQQEIFGTYTISEGAYTFSYGDFVSKDFSVIQGGTVRFNGNPLNAILDITAVYNVYTTTYELIKNEISTNENELEAAKRRTNVEVRLKMKGTLDEPVINLDIRVPDLESSNLVGMIDRKLNELRANPDELNNQVFGLLIFNSFILSDNVASGIGNLGSNIALRSVSSLVSNQLNNLADKVVKGVDVDINVNSYDSNYANDGAGGTVTEVGLKVSKQLFNDRLSISAGGNFDLSGQSTGQTYSSLIGDFVLEYKLTDSGRYRIRIFSKSDYDRLLNQNTNKNGVSIFFNRSFDSKLDD